MDITSDIAGDTGLIRSLLTDPLAGDTARPAAGAPEPTLSAAPDRVRWLPWQCCTASWQAAYNTACMYAAFTGVAPETVARVVAALERAINNPDSEMERAYDWISRDPDFTAVENAQPFGDFRYTQLRRDYPEPFAARAPVPRLMGRPEEEERALASAGRGTGTALAERDIGADWRIRSEFEAAGGSEFGDLTEDSEAIQPDEVVSSRTTARDAAGDPDIGGDPPSPSRPDHPDTLTSRNNLASTHQASGRSGDPPPTPPANFGGLGEEEHRPRFLTGILPERAPVGARISLLVQVSLTATQGVSAALEGFHVSPTGTLATITVSAPGLIPLGDLEQELTVPFAADSDLVRFGFLAGSAGLHSVQVRAFAGGTWLGELPLEISVETGAALEEGRPRTAPIAEPAAEPGEVTLQVSRTAAGGYSFQLLSEALYPVVIIDRLAGDPATVVGQMAAELSRLSKSTSQYATPTLVRRRLRSLGSQLWADVVPETIREQFWAQRDRIKLFTIASDMDTVPWELLYPVDLDYDDGFLVEQFPVVRRVYGQGRARVLQLDRGAGFIVPPTAPTNATDEVAAVRAALPAHVLDRGTENGLAKVLELLDAVPSVLHFAGHNAFTDEVGSLISLDGGPLRPGDLSYARQRRAFESVRPLVFFNGCRTAGEIPGFTQLIGWAKEFMGAGAGAFIGSLWAVRSASARTFAEEFYHALACDGDSLGAASLRARQAIAADEGDPTWLAYAVYGNPSASLTHDPRP